MMKRGTEMRNSENNEVKLNDDTGYRTPVFGTETSGAAMPKDKINDEPVAPGVAAEMIRQYLSRYYWKAMECR